MARRKTRRTTRDADDAIAIKSIIAGIVFLIIAGMLYLEYGWMEIFGVLGVLSLLKGLIKYFVY